MSRFRDLAEQIAFDEGLKRPVDIAQIGEITGIVLDRLAEMTMGDVCELIIRRKNRRRPK